MAGRPVKPGKAALTTLLLIPGKDPSRVRAISTLLHANEPSGFIAIHRWLRSSPRPPVTVAAVSDGLVTLDTDLSSDGTDPNPANDTASEDTLLIEAVSTWFIYGAAQGGTIDFTIGPCPQKVSPRPM